MKLPRLDPRWYAAPLIAAILAAGALSGSAIGSTPILARSESMIPEAPRNAGIGEFRLDTRKPPPNHYPLVTPTGTIPVTELARHGRLRDEWQAFGNHAEERTLLDADYGWELSDAEIDRLDQWQPSPARAGLADRAVVTGQMPHVIVSSPQSRDEAITRASGPIAAPVAMPQPGLEEAALGHAATSGE